MKLNFFKGGRGLLDEEKEGWSVSEQQSHIYCGIGTRKPTGYFVKPAPPLAVVVFSVCSALQDTQVSPASLPRGRTRCLSS